MSTNSPETGITPEQEYAYDHAMDVWMKDATEARAIAGIVADPERELTADAILARQRAAAARTAAHALHVELYNVQDVIPPYPTEQEKAANTAAANAAKANIRPTNFSK